METEFNTVFELYQNIVVQAAALYTRNQHTAEILRKKFFSDITFMPVVER